MGAHALLSPSAAHRWMNCPAALRLEENVQDKGSSYAAEGSLAHAYCAYKLKDFLDLPTASACESAKTTAYQLQNIDEVRYKASTAYDLKQVKITRIK